MFLKLTKQKLIDYFIISAMLSFCIGIVLVNFGEYPLLERVTSVNLVATCIYILLWALFIYLTSATKRRSAALFARIYTTASLLFQVWFVLATASQTTFIPNGAARIFSLLTVFLNNPFIGFYFFIGMTDGYTYALVSTLFVLALCAYSWILWLYEGGYFAKLTSALAEARKRNDKAARLREEIIELRKSKKEANSATEEEK
jgi:hypothetical protein